MIRHQLSLRDTSRRIVRAEVSLEAPAGDLEAIFPVWTPGSYLIREHARHIHDLTARTAGGAPLMVRKAAKNRYRVAVTAPGPIVLAYEVYAHELTVRTSHVDASHAFLNPVTLLPFFEGRGGEAHELELADLPAGWDAACALPSRRDGDRISFPAADYDVLVDSPLECGPHAAPDKRTVFQVRGVPHEIVFWGRSILDRAMLAADAARIVEAQAALFGGLPYDRYLFIALASDTARGGLEHRNSSALLFTRASLLRPKGYEDLLGLLSHELFHAWNVKRIRPAAFTPYDLTRENHTRLLWAFEGLTSYYEDLFLVRAGLMSRGRFLELLAERMTALERTPGRHRLAVADASYDAWIRYYRQDENTDNSAVSYYLKGSLVGVLLDAEIRRSTEGRKSLDDVMRLLWEEHGRTGRGVPEDGIEAACLRVVGEGLRPVLHDAIHSTGDLPLAEALRAFGLQVDRRSPVNADDRGGPAPAGQPLRCDVGLTLRTEGDRVRVASVRRGSPAEEAAIAPGDELVAVDGLRADGSTTFARLHDHAPGDAILVALFRRDELLHVEVKAGTPVLDTFAVVERPDAPEIVRARLTEWLGAAQTA